MAIVKQDNAKARKTSSREHCLCIRIRIYALAMTAAQHIAKSTAVDIFVIVSSEHIKDRFLAKPGTLTTNPCLLIRPTLSTFIPAGNLKIFDILHRPWYCLSNFTTDLSF